MPAPPTPLPKLLQSALEEACLAALRTELGYSEKDSARTFDDRPPARAGKVFCAVWSDNARDGNAKRTALEVDIGLKVTVSLRFASVPFDRRCEVRDEMEWRLNALTTLLHLDSWDFRHSRAAEVLLGISTGRVYHGGLTFLRWEPLQVVTADWYHGATSTGEGDTEVGMSQTAVFGRSKCVQPTLTAT